MSVLIAGSRKPKNPFAARLLVQEMVMKLPTGIVILNGGAQGIDQYVLDAVNLLPNGTVLDTGTQWSDPLRPLATDITAIVFRPNYKRDGNKYAPIARNDHMLNLHPEMVVVLWNGTSNGSKHVIYGARERGIDYTVIET